MKDLRVIVFPSECAFALYWMVLQMHAYCKYLLKSSFFLNWSLLQGSRGSFKKSYSYMYQI